MGKLKVIDFDFQQFIHHDSVKVDQLRANAMARDSTNHVYLALTSFWVHGVTSLIRLDSNFNVDDNFRKEISDKFVSGEVLTIHVQPDNKILIGGNFVLNLNGNYYKNICRINSDGRIDTNFYNIFSKFSDNDYNRIYCINKYDSTIYLGGNFSINTIKGKMEDLVRINNDGSLNSNQPNVSNLFKYVDDEPYFNKSMIHSISESQDSLLILTGIFNLIQNQKTKLPLAIISKDGKISDIKVKLNHEIFYIKYLINKDTDTMYLLGDHFLYKNNLQSFMRIVK